MTTHDEAMKKVAALLSSAENKGNDETARLLALAEMWLKVAAWRHTTEAENATWKNTSETENKPG